jgi:antirestriction protein ArdC
MIFAGNAAQAAQRILTAFERGDLPQALAQAFIRKHDNAPCRCWSWNNQVLVALNGFSEARGFRQWAEVGRSVKAGERAMHILAPLTKAITDEAVTGDQQKRRLIYGFKTIPVFGLEQTQGEPLPSGDPETDRWIQSLPLREVAESWGLVVQTYSGREGGTLGFYSRKGSIGVGTRNLATWAHELIHAADDRNGELQEKGQHWRSEIVAELGGAVLLECLELDDDSDRGGCWQYVESYARKADLDPLAACTLVLDRTCRAVSRVLEEAERIQTVGSVVR